MSEWIQFIFAFPMLAAGVGCFIWALMRPGSIGMIRLALFSFALQFCIGPVLAPFSPNAGESFDSADVILAFLGIYAFWGAITMTALIWRGGLDPILVARDRGLSSERGVFACLMDASLATGMLSVLAFYSIIATIRTVMIVKYGIVLSGTNTLEKVTALPYIVLVIYKTFTALGMAFGFLAMVKIVFKQPGRLWCVLILLLETAYTFTQGRRALFAYAILLLFAVLIKHGRMKLKHAILGGIGFVILVQTVFPFFYNMRIQWQSNYQAGPSIWMSEAWKMTLTGGTYGEEKRKYTNSLTQRLNALSLNYMVANRLNNGFNPVYGEFIKLATLTAIPRFMFPNKLSTIGGDDELMVYRMNIPGKDLYSNLPAFALADFGLLGGAIYGLVFALALRTFEVMMKALYRRSSLGAFAVFSVAISGMVLQMEFPPGPFANDTRLICIVYVGFYLWSSIFGGSRMPEAYGYAPQG